MKFKKCAPLLLLVGFLLLNGCNRRGWKEFSSPEGGFSILMPGTPPMEHAILNTKVGPIDAYMFGLEHNSVMYGVMYADYPYSERVSPAEMLDAGRDGIIDFSQGKLLYELIISLDGFPGREITIKDPEGRITLAKIYLVNQRVYQIITVAPREKASSDNIKRFLESFKLLKTTTLPGATIWNEFSSPEGRFSILMPGKPSQKKQPVNTKVGTFDLHMFWLERDSITYAVSYVDYPYSLIQQTSSDRILEGAVTGVQGELINQQTIALDGFPGRRFKVKVPGGFLAISKVYLVKQRFYQIFMTIPPNRGTPDDINKFLNSFRLLEG